MTIAYLVNQYPKVSHSFIRREIAGIEAMGIKVARFSIRSCSAELVDEVDKLEQELTQVVLGIGKVGLLYALIRVAITRPARFLSALWLMLFVGWHSERGILRHFAYLAEACVLLRWFDDLEIAHVHAHFGTNSTTVAMLCRALGGPPYSFTVHGHPEPLTCPEGWTRKSLALYYYTNGRPAEEIKDREHSNIFKARPGEDLTEKSSGVDIKTFLKKCVPPILLDVRDALNKR